MSEYSVPVGISIRHIHLCQADLETLFGAGHQLTSVKPLTQPGQFAAEELVNLIGPKNSISRVRILGPVRSATQVEISRTDSFMLGVSAPVRDSGDLKGSAGIIIEGPMGRIELKEGVILAQRHVHLHSTEAAEMGVADKQWASIKVGTERALTFERVLIRVGANYARDFHLDSDEGNAAGVSTGDKAILIINR